MINANATKVISFDCFGTLIDWEQGILNALRPVLSAHDVQWSDNQILDLYAQLESESETGEFKTYRDILRQVTRGIGEEAGFKPDEKELNALANSIASWKPFPDSVRALKTLSKRFKLAIVSNIDNDLIAAPVKKLKVTFQWVFTAQELKAYKPADSVFKTVVKRVGVPKHRMLHVAQSIYHDIVPATQFGIPTVWVNRRKLLDGFGATPPAYAEPDFEVSDLMALVGHLQEKK